MELPALARVLVDLPRAREPSSIASALERIGEISGAPRYIAGTVPRSPDGFLPNVRASNYPDEWLERYEAEAYHLVDPTVNFLARTDRPFRWSEALEAMPGGAGRERSDKMMKDARRFGLVDGWTFPIATRNGLTGAVATASDGDLDWDDAKVAALWGALKIVMIDEPGEKSTELPRVSRREREVLMLLGEGLVSRAIAERLDIVPTTVDWHIAQLCDRLGARNRHHLAAIAIRIGLIS